MRRVTVTEGVIVGVPEHIRVDPEQPTADGALMARLTTIVRASTWWQYRATGGPPEDLEFAPIHWLVTNDAAGVDRFQPAHDCAECRAGNERARAWLAEHPGQWIALANLTYTEVWPDEGVLIPGPHG